MIIQGDCIEEMKKLEENSIDAIITDPPYGLEFMGKEWDKFKEGERKSFVGGGGDVTDKTNDAYMRINKTANRPSALSIQQKYDMQSFFEEFGKEAIRILKPGGFMLIMGGTRTYHRLVCGIEDAGFEIRDTIMWLYGSGFPKSLNIGKQIDKRKDWKKYEEFSKKLKEKREELGLTKQQAFIKCNFKAKTFGGNSWFEHGRIPLKEDYKLLKQGLDLDNLFDNLFEEVEREFLGKDKNWGEKGSVPLTGYKEFEVTKGNSIWEGWGTALKPACEPIVVARKPLSEKNVALNVLKWGTGGINIDDCRVGNEERTYPITMTPGNFETTNGGKNIKSGEATVQGRFPANIILDEEAGKMLDEQSGVIKSGKMNGIYHGFNDGNIFGKAGKTEMNYSGDKGGASRFFYCAKASKSERNFGCEGGDYKSKRPSGVLYNKEEPDGFRDTLKRNLKNNHPTVKPLKLMEYLVKLVSKEGAIVLDPFVGSGTTAIACIKQGRKFIGIEKEEEYIKIVNARIKPYLEQTKIGCLNELEGEQ